MQRLYRYSRRLLVMSGWLALAYVALLLMPG